MEELLLIATQDRAARWRDTIRAASRLRLKRELVSDLHDELAGAPAVLADAPEARAVIALPPIALARLVPTLAQRAAASLIEPASAPPHHVLTNIPPGALWGYEWTSLAGPRRLREAWSRSPPSSARVRVQGEPFGHVGDLGLVLEHALALLQYVCGTLALARISAVGQGVKVSLCAGHVEIELSLFQGRPRVAFEIWTRGTTIVWRADDQAEQMLHGEGAAARRSSQPVVAPEQRALRRLLDPSRAGAGGPAEVQRVVELSAAIARLSPVHFAQPEASFALSRAVAREVDAGSLLPFGLHGSLPAAEPAEVMPSPDDEVPSELWAFRAGLKPVVFLTVPPDQVQRVTVEFGDCHVERRERGVEVGQQDVWVDDRTSGRAMSELYISRDAELARQACRLQTERDPSAALVRLGELMGYPACCVEAFAAQDDRSNNTRNRYLTAARTGPGEWHWELNNLSVMLVPFFPCSYRCDAARSYARATLHAWERGAPEAAARFRRQARLPALYFEHAALLHFDGLVSGEQVSYRKVYYGAGGGQAIQRLAAAATLGDVLIWRATQLAVLWRGEVKLELARVDPALGLVAPFGG